MERVDSLHPYLNAYIPFRPLFGLIIGSFLILSFSGFSNKYGLTFFVVTLILIWIILISIWYYFYRYYEKKRIQNIKENRDIMHGNSLKNQRRVNQK
jgi:predicted membrane protein